ncbi:unknown [Prevotella sp. CAG:1092]|nr:unknown [Prevotella sp. CAG:1092]
MLKYILQQTNAIRSRKTISVDEIKIHNISDESERDKLLVICHYKENENLSDGMKIFTVNSLFLKNDEKAYKNNSHYEFNEEITLLNNNTEENTFSFLINSYIPLSLETASFNIIDKKKYLYFYFKESHYFNRTKLNGDDIEKEKDRFLIYIRFSDGYQIIDMPLRCQYVTNSILRCDIDECKKELNDTIEEIRKRNDFFNPITENNWENLFKSLFHTEFVDLTTDTIADIRNIKINRDNFLYTDSNLYHDENATTINTTFYRDLSLFTLNIPFSNDIQTDIYQESNIEERFAEKEKSKSINDFIDMEKDVYYPVYEYIKGENIEMSFLRKIVFNLHFRRRNNNEEWVTDNDSYWNGINLVADVDGNRISDDYFVYSNKSEQSDLLGYLGFTNGDVKYRKNRLKKSFLRLSFYDSDNPSSQNLLGYYTVFYNINDASAKLLKHYEDDNSNEYFSLQEKNGKYEKVEADGIRVNTEPLIKNPSNDLEDLRLSSQFVVSDKYTADSTSEGFYLYLWKDGNKGVIPETLYMKVEFNHAGYGRNIPFMMPFYDIKKHPNGEGKIKSLDEIVKDFEGKGEDAPYGIRQYLKYSYVRWKYRYDKDTRKHIYYLDRDTYGNYDDNIDDDDKILKINLYEAKISPNS